MNQVANQTANTDLPMPDFINRDPQAITAEMIAWWENETGKVLQPAQIERLFINMLAYRETLVREQIQDAALQNLVDFARAPMLDYLAKLVGVVRLPAQTASCHVAFTLKSPNTMQTVIPMGTEFGNGQVSFITTEPVTIGIGQTTVVTSAICKNTGAIGNGWQIEQLSEIVSDIFIEGLTVSNTDVPAGGADVESDAGLRERIFLAPEAYTNAGSRAAYQFFARSVSQTIIDVSVITRGYGRVLVYPLTNTGLPSPTLLELIEAKLTGEKIRPLTDSVKALSPEVVGFSIEAVIYPLKGTDSMVVLAKARQSLNVYLADVTSRLGVDIVPSAVISALKVVGVYDVTLITPTQRQVIEAQQWGQVTAVNLTLGQAYER